MQIIVLKHNFVIMQDIVLKHNVVIMQDIVSSMMLLLCKLLFLSIMLFSCTILFSILDVDSAHHIVLNLNVVFKQDLVFESKILLHASYCSQVYCVFSCTIMFSNQPLFLCMILLSITEYSSCFIHDIVVMYDVVLICLMLFMIHVLCCLIPMIVLLPGIV